MKQSERILEYIDKFGSITPLDAFRDLGITKLATRISEMQKEGIIFEKTYESSKNRFGQNVRYMRYRRGAENGGRKMD